MTTFRARLIVLLVAASAVLIGSFGVAAAGEREPAYVFDGEDCGCTGAARAKDRVERGLIVPAPDAPAAPE